MIQRIARLFVFEWRKLVARRLALVAILLVALVAGLAPAAGQAIDIAQSISQGKQAAGTEFKNAWTTLASGLRTGLAFATIIVLVFAGSSIAEESYHGTLKALLLRPVKRGELLLAKWLALSSFAVFLVVVMTLAAGGVAGASYGFGDVVDPEFREMVKHTRGDMIGFTASALLRLVPALLALVAFALVFSTAIDHPGYAVGAAIAVFLLLGAVGALSSNIGKMLFPQYLGLSLTQLGDLAEQYSSAKKEFREAMIPTVLIPGASAFVFLLGAGWLLGSRDVGD